MSDLTIDNRRARLIEYAPWIARDYITNQGPSSALVVVLIALLSIMPALAGVRWQLGQVPEEVAVRMLRAMAPTLAFLGTFFATNGIVSNDRKTGYYRFLFAKPVSPPAYYATTFAVYGLGVLAVSAALLGIWALTVRPMFPPELLPVIALMYVAYGGLGFLCSAIWRFDWLSLVVVIIVANIGWTVWGKVDGIRHWVLYVLPPVHRSNDMYALIVRDSAQAIPWTSGAWLAGYGLACFLLGLLVIRRRPLGSS